ncbi:MAG TPA: carboxyl transferase domain-containing protein [Kofleriaceae bacterium]|nr:carboxyl transferase domain-containing protein [Kofleriaceae bacterium]
MPHVPLRPIGSPRPRAVDDDLYAEHRRAVAALEERLARERAQVEAGWGPKYVDRVHAKGKMTARERIAALMDAGTPVHEVGTFVNHGEVFPGDLRSPAAGVVTAFVRVEGRWCMVIANDNTVASGAWWPRTPEKIERAQTMALRLRLPTIYLVDCSGLFLPEQSRSFPGATGAGHIFKMNSLLSAAGVPQIAGVFGDCIAGGGYMPIISDRVYMTEQAYMVIAGAALIKGAKSVKLTSLDIGGPEVHVHQSGCADERVPDDATAIDCIRREVRRLPGTAADFYRGGVGPCDPLYPAGEIAGLLPPDHREPYDASQILARLCDQSLFWELLPSVGDEMIVGVGRVGGLYAGFIVNRQGLVSDPDHPGRRRPGGILYRQGIAKVSAFSRACNDDGIPILWLQDISGFDIGVEAERHGLLAYGSNLIYTNSTNQVPMFTVLLRKASGAGYYAMSGLPYDPVVQLSTTLSRLSVMEGRTLAIAAYHTRLDDDFQIAEKDPAERARIEAGMREVEARIESDMDPFVAGRQMDTDEIVELASLRPWLAAAVEMSYQSIGHRRIKNPRIWSLHDLDVLFAAAGAQAAPRAETSRATAAAASSRPADTGGLAVRAPSSGRYWARPAPDKPPFVRVGDLVTAGQTVCLLEVMKTFHRVSYGGPDLPERARITAIHPQDGDDLTADQVIVELAPA